MANTREKQLEELLRQLQLKPPQKNHGFCLNPLHAPEVRVGEERYVERTKL